jgi:HK97 family phage major capsid protein
VPDLLDQLRDQRTAARTTADEILNRAAAEQRDLTATELAEHGRQVVAEREAADAMDAERDRQLAELRAAPTRRPGGTATSEPVLTREQSVSDWLQARGAFDRYQDGEPLSLQRYLRGMATGEWDGADHERALAEATVGAGGALVPAPLSARVIDLARNATRVFQAGAITVPMTSQTLALARLTSEGSPVWKTEGSNITAADLAFDRVTFTARTLVRRVDLSVELFEDADPSSEDVIARSFAGQMAVELDRVALLGSGTPPEPRGVLNMSGITTTTHGANGAAIATATAYDWHRRRRRRPGCWLHPECSYPGAQDVDQPVEAARGDHVGLPDAAGEHAPDAGYQIGPHQRDHGHQHRHELYLYRPMGPAHGRNQNRLYPTVPGRAVPGRHPELFVRRLSQGGYPIGAAERVCRRHRN